MLYALIIEDRHTDVEVRLFESKEQAIDAARQRLEYEAERRRESFDDYYNQPDPDDAAYHERPWFKDHDGTDGWWFSAMWAHGREDYLSVREVDVEDAA